MYERNFHWENLTGRLGQFAAFLDTSNITKLFESLVNSEKNKSQKMLLPEITKLAKQILALPATNATSERSFSAIKHIKSYLRSTTSGNRLNHCMLLHVHCKNTDQLHMIEIAKEFVGDTQARLRTLKIHLNYNYLFKTKTERQKFLMFSVISYKSNMRQNFRQCFNSPADAPAQFFSLF